MQRRDFIKNLSAGVVLPTFLNGYSLTASAMGINAVDEKSDHVLVVIQLNGGNDGLNTVIPLSFYSNYQAARANIAIPEAKALKLDGGKIGLNPAMTELFKLYDEGKVRVVQSVGYPNPSFSHFRATDIWNTGADSDKVISSGWAGRYFGYYNPNYPNNYPNAQSPDPLAINIGSVVSPALQGPVSSMGLAISSVTNFYNLLNNKYDSDTPNTPSGKALAYLRKTASQTNDYSASIKKAADRVPTQGAYPANNGLANQLKIVARLIAGGMKTKLYIVNLGGFDTHSTQTVAADTTTGTHANLLKNLSDGIGAFMADLKTLGVSKRVMGMTFSEFGRRMKSNDSGGTDHGSAAPMFVFGDAVNPGITGNAVEIPLDVKTGDNVQMQYDFRSVYASILQNWFCMESADMEKVLLKNYQSLNIVQAQACGITLSQEPEPQQERIVNAPNPFSNFTNLRFRTDGGHTLIQIFDTTGRLIAVPVDDNFMAGTFDAPLNTDTWPSGVYFARLQNNANQQIRRMLKV